MTCIKAIITGRVQGVFFRESTRQQAQRLNITGHAINLPDGSVEVVACGDESALQQLIHWLHQGPAYADVTEVRTQSIAIIAPSDFRTG